MASQFEQLESLVALTASLDSGKLDNVYDAVAQSISAGSMQKMAEAIDSIKSVGEQPSDYIAQPRSVLRQQQQAQRLRHQDELHQVELRRLIAEARIAEGSADRMTAPVSH